MKCLVLLGDYFEDTEALTSIDVLVRGKEIVVKAAVKDDLIVYSQTGGKIICDALLKDINYRDFDYLLIPGGKASFTILNNNKLVEEIIDYFVKNEKLVASICAAPHLLGRKGYFNNLEYTCFPGFEKYCIGGIYKNQGVVVTKKFITAKSMYYSIDFALAILEYLYGKEYSKKIELSLKGE